MNHKLKIMETLGTNKQKENELRRGAMFACTILNEVVIPICRDLNFLVDVSDIETIDGYMRNLSFLREDYINAMSDGANNPALVTVIKKSAEELWSNAESDHHLKNPYIINEIPDDICDYLLFTGKDVNELTVRANIPAITESCVIVATKEDIAKRDEIRNLCDSINKCFNGLGMAFNQYIYLATDGNYYPIHTVTNYKPLIYGRNK